MLFKNELLPCTLGHRLAYILCIYTFIHLLIPAIYKKDPVLGLKSKETLPTLTVFTSRSQVCQLHMM